MFAGSGVNIKEFISMGFTAYFERRGGTQKEMCQDFVVLKNSGLHLDSLNNHKQQQTTNNIAFTFLTLPE